MSTLITKMLANQNIQPQSIQITPLRHSRSFDFLMGLELEYIDQKYFEQRKNELNDHLYEFEVQYRQSAWTIRKQFKDFETLEQSMLQYKLYHSQSDLDQSLDVSNPQEMLKKLNDYLQCLVKSHSYAKCLYRFLEISFIKIDPHSKKYKETFILKKEKFSDSWSILRQKRYLIITSEGVKYSEGAEKDKCQIKGIIQYDYHFRVLQGTKETGDEKVIILESSSQRWNLKANNLRQFFDVIYCLQTAKKQSPYAQLHRFDSFAPVREQSTCKWFVDGSEYYQEVYNTILQAKETIFITDWWLSPELYLVRPVSDNVNSETRLDKVLKSVADRGIKVNILVYQEPKIALTNDSAHTNDALEKLSKNIKVLRHPLQLRPKLFSHHEKMVVIDSKVGFMGGLDLCFGRMDTQQHHLFEPNQDSDPTSKYWPGIDFSNSRVKDFFNVKQIENQLIPKDCPRMPWHDIALRLTGETVKDMTRHFIQYWNYVTNGQWKQENKDPILTHQQQKPNAENSQDNRFKAYIKEIETENGQMEDQIVKSSRSNNSQFPMERMVSRQQNNTQSNLDPNRNKDAYVKILKQLQNIDHQQDAKYYIPQSQEQQQQSDTETETEIINENEALLKQVDVEQADQTKKQGIPDQCLLLDDVIEYRPKIIESQLIQQSLTIVRLLQPTSEPQISQMVRSASDWSIGLNNEFSIQTAYIQLIFQAKHFIYIENQFFISSTAGSPVQNLIGTTLVQRIKQAADLKENLIIIVFLPLLPGFEGQIDDPSSVVLRVQLHWEYFTISRGGQSIIEQLRNYNIVPEDYIEFYSLRQHGGPIAATEIIYIHSKLMIVDDEVVLIGSANINDRSLMGSRDSEIAMVIQDQSLIQIKMNGKPFQANSFAHTLRTNIFMEHFGMKYEDVKDPLDDTLQQRIREQSKTNTAIYREIFACYPDDNVLTLEQYREFKEKKNLSLYQDKIKGVIGHAVQFPLHFMENENLKEIRITQKEYYCPEINFT